MKKKKALLILETMEETEFFLNSIYPNNDDFKECSILSFQPDIQSLLLQHNIKSISSAEIASAESYDLMMGKCEELECCIDRYIEVENVELPEAYFKTAYMFYITHIWRHLIWNIEVVDKALQNEPYTRLISFVEKKYIFNSPWVHPAQHYMGELVQEMCSVKGIEFIPIKLPSKEITKFINRESNSLYNKIINKASYHLLKIAGAIFSKEKSILIPSFDYNMNKVCDDLTSRNNDLKICRYYEGKDGIMELAHAFFIFINTLLKKKFRTKLTPFFADFIFPVLTFARYHKNSYDDTICRKYITHTIVALEKQSSDKTLFKGVNIFGIFKQKVLDDLIHFMLRIRFLANGLEKWIDFIKPGFIITQYNFGINAALEEISNKLNIPSVLISHGSHVYQQNRYARKEHEILARNILVGKYKYLAVQSPLANEICSHLVDDQKKIIKIKPLLWGRAINKRQREKDYLTLVHAGTFKRRNYRRYMYETSDEMILGMRELCLAVSGLSNLRLMIKFRQDVELSYEAFKSLLPETDTGNVIVETERPFGEVMEETDLLISFSSTTIEEALVNNIPVLLYGGYGRYSHIPEEPFSRTNNSIQKPVSFVNNTDNLKEYMIKLNQIGCSFHVPAQKFEKYHFNDNDATDFEEWFFSVMEKSA